MTTLVLTCVLAIAVAGACPFALRISVERAVAHAQSPTPAARPEAAPPAPPRSATPSTWTLWEVSEYSEAGTRTTSERGQRPLREGLSSLECLNGASTRLEALRTNVSGLPSGLIRNGVVYRTPQGDFVWKFVCLRAGELP